MVPSEESATVTMVRGEMERALLVAGGRKREAVPPVTVQKVHREPLLESRRVAERSVIDEAAAHDDTWRKIKSLH
jgi:hypothetical protein